MVTVNGCYTCRSRSSGGELCNWGRSALKYIWVNVCDISSCEPVLGGLCIPLLVFDGCDKLGCYFKPGGNVDESYLVYKVDDESRAQAMPDCFELIGKRKISRKIRTRLSVKPPDDTWRLVSADTPNS